jgi:hypothetical protein
MAYIFQHLSYTSVFTYCFLFFQYADKVNLLIKKYIKNIIFKRKHIVLTKGQTLEIF